MNIAVAELWEWGGWIFFFLSGLYFSHGGVKTKRRTQSAGAVRVIREYLLRHPGGQEKH